MTEPLPPIEPDADDGADTLAPACARALEAWVCEDPASRDADGIAAQEHIQLCASCRELAESIQLDQDLLRWQLGRLEPTPTPRLELRDPLRSASGHPRRVSLTVLPYLLGVFLVVMLGSLYLGGALLTRWVPQWTTENRLRQVQASAATQLDAPLDATSLPPRGWVDQLSSELPETIQIDGYPPAILDGFGTPIRLRASLAESGAWIWRAESAGEDGAFESADDLLSL